MKAKQGNEALPEASSQGELTQGQGTSLTDLDMQMAQMARAI